MSLVAVARPRIRNPTESSLTRSPALPVPALRPSLGAFILNAFFRGVPPHAPLLPLAFTPGGVNCRPSDCEPPALPGWPSARTSPAKVGEIRIAGTAVLSKPYHIVPPQACQRETLRLVTRGGPSGKSFAHRSTQMNTDGLAVVSLLSIQVSVSTACRAQALARGRSGWQVNRPPRGRTTCPTSIGLGGFVFSLRAESLARHGQCKVLCSIRFGCLNELRRWLCSVVALSSGSSNPERTSLGPGGWGSEANAPRRIAHQRAYLARTALCADIMKQKERGWGLGPGGWGSEANPACRARTALYADFKERRSHVITHPVRQLSAVSCALRAAIQPAAASCRGP
jgi:hypothetical protein